MDATPDITPESTIVNGGIQAPRTINYSNSNNNNNNNNNHGLKRKAADEDLNLSDSAKPKLLPSSIPKQVPVPLNSNSSKFSAMGSSPKWITITDLLCLCFQFLSLREKVKCCMPVSKHFRICTLNQSSINAFSCRHSISLDTGRFGFIDPKTSFLNSSMVQSRCITHMRIEIKDLFWLDRVLTALTQASNLQSVEFLFSNNLGYVYSTKQITTFLDQTGDRLINASKLKLTTLFVWTPDLADLLDCFMNLIDLSLNLFQFDLKLFCDLVRYTPHLRCLSFGKVRFEDHTQWSLLLSQGRVPGLASLTYLGFDKARVFCDSLIQWISKCTNLVALDIKLHDQILDSINGHYKPSFVDRMKYEQFKAQLLAGVADSALAALSFSQLTMLTKGLKNLQYLSLDSQPIMDDLSTLQMIACNCEHLRVLKCFTPIVESLKFNGSYIEQVIQVLNQFKNLIVLDLSFFRSYLRDLVNGQLIIPFLLNLTYVKYFYPCVVDEFGNEIDSHLTFVKYSPFANIRSFNNFYATNQISENLGEEGDDFGDNFDTLDSLIGTRLTRKFESDLAKSAKRAKSIKISKKTLQALMRSELNVSSAAYGSVFFNRNFYYSLQS